MSAHSNAEIVRMMLDSGVLVERSDGGFELTEAFQERVETKRHEIADLDPDERASRIARAWSGRDSPLDVVQALSVDSLGVLLAVNDHLNDVDERSAARILVAIERLRSESVPEDGAPNAFLPVTAAELETIVAVYDACIAYVWRRNCDPCELMQETFDEIFEDSPEDLLAVAIYGPDDAQLLSDRYDVVGGPTTLFFSDGRINSRLIGAHHASVVESEIESITS